jgi:hypothetical protein
LLLRVGRYFKCRRGSQPQPPASLTALWQGPGGTRSLGPSVFRGAQVALKMVLPFARELPSESDPADFKKVLESPVVVV